MRDVYTLATVLAVHVYTCTSTTLRAKIHNNVSRPSVLQEKCLEIATQIEYTRTVQTYCPLSASSRSEGQKNSLILIRNADITSL